jgi:UDPglucose--hexose-1-phosphate uridylyltransferase
LRAHESKKWMKKTSISLADGRELMYFDERDDVSRDDADLRPLTPTQTSSEIRYDELLDRWVIVASHRQDRTYHPTSDSCPLCPSTAGRLTDRVDRPHHRTVASAWRGTGLLFRKSWA